jgi:DNA repair exonuclease SbcCD ATPase subunit
LAIIAAQLPQDQSLDPGKIITLSLPEINEIEQRLHRDLDAWNKAIGVYNQLQTTIREAQDANKKYLDNLKIKRDTLAANLQALDQLVTAKEAQIWSDTEFGIPLIHQLTQLHSEWKIQQERWANLSAATPIVELKPIADEIESWTMKIDNLTGKIQSSLDSYQKRRNDLEKAIAHASRQLDAVRQSKFFSDIKPKFDQIVAALLAVKDRIQIGRFDDASGELEQVNIRLKEIIQKIADIDAVTEVLSKLKSGIDKENYERVASLYLDPEADRGFFYKLFREFVDLNIEIDSPTLEDGVATANVKEFTRVDRVLNKKSSLSGYRVFLQKVDGNWKVVRFSFTH